MPAPMVFFGKARVPRVAVAARVGVDEDGVVQVSIDAVAVRIGEREVRRVGADTRRFTTIRRDAVEIGEPRQTLRNAQLPVVHWVVAFARAHTWPQPPQFASDVLVFVSQPSE